MRVYTNKDPKEVCMEEKSTSTVKKKRKPDAELPVQPKPKPVVK